MGSNGARARPAAKSANRTAAKAAAKGGRVSTIGAAKRGASAPVKKSHGAAKSSGRKDVRAYGFRTTDRGDVAVLRLKQPVRPTAPSADPPATPDRSGRAAATHATLTPALRRYLDPNFYAAPTATRAEPTWIGEIAGSDAAVRMDLVRHGVPARAVAALADVLAMSRDELTRELGLARATVERKLRDGGRLGQAESERVLGMTRLIAQVQRVVNESGDPAGFDAPRWVAGWLQTPAPALGGRPPIAYMDTAEGRGVVSQLVDQMQSGAYA